MADEVIQRLLNSFSVLEQAINGARENLSSKEQVPSDVLHRIESYSELLSKQKSVAGEIMECVKNADWEMVARKIQIINGLLDMIRQDAKDIVSALKTGEPLDDEDDDSQIPIC